MNGSSGGAVNLQIVETDASGNITYSMNQTVQYGCSSSDFHSSIIEFKSFASYEPSTVRYMFDTNGNETNLTSDAANYEYHVSLPKKRSASYQS